MEQKHGKLASQSGSRKCLADLHAVPHSPRSSVDCRQQKFAPEYVKSSAYDESWIICGKRVHQDVP
eukprot:3742065-Pleurochrysis_carterae.AAC.4